jgi:hypothetical protein
MRLPPPVASYRANLQARADRERTGTAMSLLAFFSAFAFIAAVAFGTTSVHPF